MTPPERMASEPQNTQIHLMAAVYELCEAFGTIY